MFSFQPPQYCCVLVAHSKFVNLEDWRTTVASRVTNIYQWMGSWSWMEGILWGEDCSCNWEGEAQLCSKQTSCLTIDTNQLHWYSACCTLYLCGFATWDLFSHECYSSLARNYYSASQYHFLHIHREQVADAKPVQEIPILPLSEIDFTAPKWLKSAPANTSGNPSTSSKNEPPSETKKQDFFSQIAKEQQKPIILSVFQPYNSSSFVHSTNHLPCALQTLFKPAYLEYDFTQVSRLAERYLHDEVTTVMVDHLAKLTQEQSKARSWFKYRARWIRASRFRQVLHTDPCQPMLSLLKSVCYP